MNLDLVSGRVMGRRRLYRDCKGISEKCEAGICVDMVERVYELFAAYCASAFYKFRLVGDLDDQSRKASDTPRRFFSRRQLAQMLGD